MCADEVAETVIGILDKLGVKEACVVGHSYGTFIAGVLARQYRKRVHTLCLIDPVCFGMFMPHLLYNFLYRVPKWRGVSFTG
jgi:pimeloyl-ACP methyl ester carboxylesterase